MRNLSSKLSKAELIWEQAKTMAHDKWIQEMRADVPALQLIAEKKEERNPGWYLPIARTRSTLGMVFGIELAESMEPEVEAALLIQLVGKHVSPLES